MQDSLHPLLQELLDDHGFLAVVLVIVIMAPVVIILLRAWMKNRRQERQIRRVIRRLGLWSMHNIQLPDGTGGEVTIEHLLLGRDAIHVVGVKRFEGLIFGSPHTDQWTQVINRQSYKFDNPDYYLQRQVNAVKLMAPGARVSGWHLFGHGASFPKGKSENVLLLDDVRSLPKRPRRRDIPKPLLATWKQLAEALSS